MARRNKMLRVQYTLVHSVCSLLFCVFTFIYLYCYQCDVIAVAQHRLSSGATQYDTFIGAALITFVLFIVHVFVYSISRLERWFYWLTYFPSFLLLAILTDVSPEYPGGLFNDLWLWLGPVLLLVYIFAVRIFGEVDSLGKNTASASSVFSKTMWLNALLLSICMLAVTAIGNSDALFHNRIKIENDIIAGRYADALRVGENSPAADASTTMLRVYALAASGQLPERMFEYPIVGGSASLKPNGRDVSGIMINNSDIIKFINHRRLSEKNIIRDYELCSYLADCSLDKFKRSLSKTYSIDSLLPKHYKEALLIANKVSARDSVGYADSVMLSDYANFVQITSRCKENGSVMNEIRKKYSRTYWYYYWSKQKKR